MRTCNFEGCDKKHLAKGYCAGHYNQLRRGEKLRELEFRRSNSSDPWITFNEKKVWSKDNFCNGTPCLEWTGGKDGDGYGTIWANGKHERAHRWIYMQWYNIPAPELKVLHHCDNHPCCNPWHLFLGTHQKNMDDMKRKGRQAKGEENGMSKLNNKLVLEIRKKYDTGDYSYRRLADKYGVSRQHISKIVLRKTWRHV